MRRKPRRPIYYSVMCLWDGTVLSAYPVRKPMPKTLKQNHMRIDDDGVCREFGENGAELSDVHNQTRTRFQDILANSLNTRRAIRAVLVPRLEALETEFKTLQTQLDRIEHAIAALPGARANEHGSDSLEDASNEL